VADSDYNVTKHKNLRSIMPNFRYIAINRDNKKVAGQITAETEEQARKELHRLSFSVLTMTLDSEKRKQTATGVKNFEFEGVDKTGKPVKGTIEGTSELPAYRRLVEEYQFRVAYLANEDATPEEKSNMRKQGLWDLQTMYLQSKKDLEVQSRTLGEKVRDYFSEWLGEGESEEYKSERKRKRREEFLKQVDDATRQTQEFMEKNAGKLVGQVQHDVQVALDHVIRIRNSNNEKNIQVATEDLLKLLQKTQEALDMEVKVGTGKIDYQRIEINTNPEMQHSDETVAEYFVRLKNILHQKNTRELLGGVFKDFAMLFIAPQRGVTWKRIGLKFEEYFAKHKAERREEIALQKAAREGSAVQARHHLQELVWIWHELHGFAGLLLFFYVFYFVIAGIIATKNLGIDPELFRRTLESDLLRQMLLVTFMLYFFGEIYNLYLFELKNKVRFSYVLVCTVLFVFFSVNL